MQYSVLLSLVPALVGAVSIPSYSGLTATFSDEFWGDAGSTPDTSTWNIITGDLGNNNEEETYSSSNSNLQISGGGTVQLVPWRDSSATYGWTSARIETVDTVTPEAGKTTRVEASLRMGSNNAKQGMWPAFWMLGESMREGTSWPLCGELDIMEQVDGILTGYGTVHCDSSSGGLCDEPNGLGSSVSISDDTVFHTWSIVWDRTSNNWETESITWYLDGTSYYTLTGSSLGDQATWSILAHSPFYIILNLAVGGDWPGEPDSSTEDGYGSMMEVEYVAVYSS